ncbi:MAG: hypothetical protein HY052_03115 [Proteobacteria bacterium]|nr:hypothetical protein [Pseudomonadota bacterium]
MGEVSQDLKKIYDAGKHFTDTKLPKFLQKIGMPKGLARGISGFVSAYVGGSFTVDVALIPMMTAGLIISGAAVVPAIAAGATVLALFTVPAVFGAGMTMGGFKMAADKLGFIKNKTVPEGTVSSPPAASAFNANTTASADFKNAAEGAKPESHSQPAAPVLKDAPSV